MLYIPNVYIEYDDDYRKKKNNMNIQDTKFGSNCDVDLVMLHSYYFLYYVCIFGFRIS